LSILSFIFLIIFHLNRLIQKNAFTIILTIAKAFFILVFMLCGMHLPIFRFLA